MPNTQLDALLFPAKRDVKQMVSQLDKVAAGAVIGAAFAQDRYGHFEIVGPVVSLSGGYRVVAARQIDSNGTPDSSLRGLTLDGELVGDTGSAEDVSEIEHGDAVVATFKHQVYGRFQVVGVAVRTRSGFLLRVGEWLLTTGGKPAEALVGVRKLESAGEHSLPVPERSGEVLGQLA